MAALLKRVLTTLTKLSDVEREAVKLFLDSLDCEQDLKRNAAFKAKIFLSRLISIPEYTSETDKSLIEKINSAVVDLKESSFWHSTDDLPHEIWRDIDGYEDLYQVSIFGRVKSFQGDTIKIMKANKSENGYFRVPLSKSGVHKNFGVHVLVARAFISNPDLKPEVNHCDGNKTNNCVWNLAWVTGSENHIHALQNGLKKSGADNPCAKLNASQVAEIRRLYQKGDSKFG